MYLHIGKNCVIPYKNIITIIDNKTIGKSSINEEFLNICLEEGFIENLVDKEEIKTYIITEETSNKNENIMMRTKIYSSNISSNTLLKRMDLI